MKTMIKYSGYFGFILALCVMVFSGCSCSTSKPTPDPLAGWKTDFKRQPDQTIVRDYEDYIQKLSPEERKLPILGPFFEDGTGQHAIMIAIDLDGTDWSHILFYDKQNKRIKVIKYISGHSRS